MTDQTIIRCAKCGNVVGKAEKLYEHTSRGMVSYCIRCASILIDPDDSPIPDFLRGFAGKRKP